MALILPTNDLMFKKLFGSDENKPVLQGLIYDVWGMDVALEDITIVQGYSIDAYEEALRDRHGNLDPTWTQEIVLRETLRDITVVCPLEDVLTELQIHYEDDFDLRALYYAFRRFADNYNVPGRMRVRRDGRPMRFSSLRPVKILSILGHTRFPNDKDAFRVFDLYDTTHAECYPREPLKVAAFELTKPRAEGRLGFWHEFFTGAPLSPDAPEYIRQAEARLDYSNLSAKERTVIDLLQKAEDRLDSELDTAWHGGYNEGRQEGRQEGCRQTVADMVAAMRTAGLNAQMIAQIQALAQHPSTPPEHAQSAD